MSTIIEVQNVSKKYIVSHEQQAYNTLVETVSNQARSCLSRLRRRVSPKAQEEFWALQNIDLTIAEGDRVGIIGKNGAGKSTLLKILARITEPTTGRIKIRGRVSSLLEVGTGFHPELTGRENIYLNGALLGMKRQEIKQKFEEIVSFAEVEKFLDTPVKRFSSGMHTRLGFAIAAHLDPDVFIVDEVLAVGDAQFQAKCLKKLNDLSSHGRTVLFVSHDIGSILTLCTKGIYLEKGQVKESGLIGHCVNAYLQNYHLQANAWEGIAGDEHVKFYRAKLSTPQNNQHTFFYQGEKTQLEIEYEVFKPSLDLKIGIEVWNNRNQQLASSHTSDNVDNFHLFTHAGCHHASFSLDTGLFHEGEYSIKLDCAIHKKKRILNNEISLKFTVYEEKKNTHFSHAVERNGIFLGHHWQLL